MTEEQANADKKRAVEEKKLAVEEKRLAVEEKKLAAEEKKLAAEEEKLADEKQAKKGCAGILVVGVLMLILWIAFAGDDEPASDVPASNAESAPASEPAPLSELELKDYFAQCHKAPEADFTRDCLGKKVVWTLWFENIWWGYEDAGVKMHLPKGVMYLPKKARQIYGFTSQFWVYFEHTLDLDNRNWTGRHAVVAGVISERSDVSYPILTNARIVNDDSWRERAIEKAAERSDVLSAYWSQSGSFWVGMPRVKESMELEALQICALIWQAGRPVEKSVVVTVLDAAHLALDDFEIISKKRCP